MNKTTTLLGTLITLATLIATVLPAIAAPKTKTPANIDTAMNDAQRTFESFKALAGDWRGEDAKGAPVLVTYETLAGGHSVVEKFTHTGHGENAAMLTVYHLDGDSLRLTHYCMAGNEPRMRAESYSANSVKFELVDVTGLDSPDEGHMHMAEFVFDGKDSFSTAWTFRENGVDQFTEDVRLERVK